ncbi:hypothetical protein [Halopelagius fulvigenes]|uniref:Uncharacterized protein n=1 Tax=Halopelagius fulvigenes TaxID=1198324 RepID=A0ABD5TYF4_9EURY
MSNSSAPAHDERVGVLGKLVETSPATLQTGLEILFAPIRFLAFWLAVTLPFLYLPLLISGLQGEQVTVFGTLLALNVAALVVGHGHAR